jgi:hypothetical protein
MGNGSQALAGPILVAVGSGRGAGTVPAKRA